jgi:hypothetical protein
MTTPINYDLVVSDIVSPKYPNDPVLIEAVTTLFKQHPDAILRGIDFVVFEGRTYLTVMDKRA